MLLFVIIKLKKRRNAIGANMKKRISSKSLFIVVLVLSILTILLMLFPDVMIVFGPNVFATILAASNCPHPAQPRWPEERREV